MRNYFLANGFYDIKTKNFCNANNYLLKIRLNILLCVKYI